ncbi:MAG: hypothetical protein JWP57_1539 [Spirosoma sp.]|nr:hypothetical protein [Spirosoma sp.]
MTNQSIESVFDTLFKFSVGQELRHKGDSKDRIADMGLLVLKRVMFENQDDDGNRGFERAYHCRLVKYSGSGEIGQFSERELLTVDEYDQEVADREQKQTERREKMRVLQEDIYKAFGVTKHSRITLKSDPETQYRVSGWGTGKDGSRLHLTEVYGLEEGTKKADVTHPDQIIVEP